MTLYAKWTPESYTVRFETNGGTAVDSQTIEYDTTAAAPAATTKTGYTFAGWYKDAAFESAWDFTADKVTENTVLYARWTINI